MESFVKYRVVSFAKAKCGDPNWAWKPKETEKSN